MVLWPPPRPLPLEICRLDTTLQRNADEGIPSMPLLLLASTVFSSGTACTVFDATIINEPAILGDGKQPI